MNIQETYANSNAKDNGGDEDRRLMQMTDPIIMQRLTPKLVYKLMK